MPIWPSTAIPFVGPHFAPWAPLSKPQVELVGGDEFGAVELERLQVHVYGVDQVVNFKHRELVGEQREARVGELL